MNCPACQRPIRRGAQFCTHCGAHIAFEEAPQHGAEYHDEHQETAHYVDDDAFYDDDDAYYDEPPQSAPLEDAHGLYVEHDDYALEAVDAFEVRDISQPGLPERRDHHSIPPAEDVNASQELEAILARLTGKSEEEEPTPPRHAAAAERALASADATDTDDDSFVLGGDFDALDDGFSLGADEDSGPIPVSADDIEQTHRDRTQGDDKTPMSVVVRDWLMSARERASAMPRQVVLVIVAALLVFTLGYVVLSGDDEGDADTSATASQSEDGGLSVSADMDSAASRPVKPAEDAIAELLEEEADPAEYSVIADAPEEGAGAAESPAAAPSKATPDPPAALANDPANAFLATAKPLSTKATKIPRPCVLREGPASKFRLVKSLVPAHSEVTVIAKSSGNWHTVTQGERSGWAKPGCNGSGCTLRRGPGESFKQVTGKDDSVKPRRPVISSSRWKYIEFDGAFGWTGPACWK